MQEHLEKNKKKTDNLIHSKKKLDLQGYELVSVSTLERLNHGTKDIIYTYKIKL
jgi:hypothetical protein